MADMLRVSASPPVSGQALALQACAERAGTALACAYSSSAEFDAELIAARRAAGVYGPKRQRRQIITAAAAIAAALAVIFLLVG
jgi:hypothetical protein